MKKQIRAIYTRINGVEKVQKIEDVKSTVASWVVILIIITTLLVLGATLISDHPVFSSPARVECQ